MSRTVPPSRVRRTESRPPGMSISALSPGTRPRRIMLTAIEPLPVPQERVKSSTPRSKVTARSAAPPLGQTKLPYFHIDGVDDNEKCLRDMCEKGLYQRYEKPTEDAVLMTLTLT